MTRLHAMLLCGLSLCGPVACATAPEPAGSPTYAAIQTTPASPRARLYADCVAQSAADAAFAQAQDEDSDLILFTCKGAPARAFYDGLADHSAAVGSEFRFDGRIYRSTNPVIANLFGVDYCSTDGVADFTCVITLNAGDFLRQATD